MGALALINHAINLLAPAVWLACLLPLLARWVVGRAKRAPAMGLQMLAVLLAGSATLVLGLILQGSDGKLLTYLALVVSAAGVQALMLRR